MSTHTHTHTPAVQPTHVVIAIVYIRREWEVTTKVKRQERMSLSRLFFFIFLSLVYTMSIGDMSKAVVDWSKDELKTWLRRKNFPEEVVQSFEGN